jgi:flagellar hook-length control protein FliK
MKVTDTASTDTSAKRPDDSSKPSKDFSRVLAEKKNKGAEEKRSKAADAKPANEAAAQMAGAMPVQRENVPVVQQAKSPAGAALPPALQNLVHEIAVATGPGNQARVDIQLNSTSFDGLKISLIREQSGVSIQFLSRSSEVASLLTAHTAQLTQALAARGVDVSSIRVRTTTDSGASMTTAAAAAQRHRPRRQS